MTVTPITAQEAGLPSSTMIHPFLWFSLIAFAFVGTIISVTIFVKWQQSQMSFSNRSNEPSARTSTPPIGPAPTRQHPQARHPQSRSQHQHAHRQLPSRPDPLTRHQSHGVPTRPPPLLSPHGMHHFAFPSGHGLSSPYTVTPSPVTPISTELGGKFPFTFPPPTASTMPPPPPSMGVSAGCSVPFSPLRVTRSAPVKPTSPSGVHFGFSSYSRSRAVSSITSNCTNAATFGGFNEFDFKFNGFNQFETARGPTPNVSGQLEHVQVLLDWDDTLFPTSFTLKQMGSGKTSSDDLAADDRLLLQQLQGAVMAMLVEFVRLFGGERVAIVTNATRNWVLSESSQMYRGLFGAVTALCRQHGVPVISATDSYGSKKALAFMDVLRGKRAVSQVLSIGDSKDEYEAVHSVCSVFRSASEGSPRRRKIHYYRCKLMERPSLKQMLSQIQSLHKLDYHQMARQQFDRSFEFN